MRRSVFVISVLAIAGFVVPAQSPTGRAMAQAAAPSAQTHDEHHPATVTTPVAAEDVDGQVTAMQRQMRGDLKATDAALEPLVARMNATTGESKVTAMAAVITALVQERAAMRDMSMQMDTHMMAQLMGHAAADMSPEMMAAMANCPMMKMLPGTATAR